MDLSLAANFQEKAFFGNRFAYTLAMRGVEPDSEDINWQELAARYEPAARKKVLDDLILELRDGLGSTIVVVTHELASLLRIGDNSVFLDADTKTMTAVGNPKKLRDESPDPKVHTFLTRGEE